MGVEGMQYLIMGSVVGGASTSCLYYLGNLANHTHWTIRECLFQYIAPKLSISEEYLSDVVNLSSMARILRQMGLKTHRNTWLHDANPDAGDSIQYGFLRLPTGSCTLRAMSFLKVTHYLDIAHNAAHVTAVGDTEALHELMRVSKRASARKITQAEIDRLRLVFGLKKAWTSGDRMCAKLERRVVALVFIICCFVMLYWTDDAEVSSVSKCWSAASVLLVFTWLFHYEEAFLGRVVVVGRDLTETLLPRVEQSNDQYYLFLARSNYFEIQQHIDFRISHPKSYPPRSLRTDRHTLYAIPLVPQFLDTVAQRLVLAPDAMLYIGTHNPFSDPPLADVIELVQKAAKDVVLVVILPPLESFTIALAGNTNRMHTSKCSQFVSTQADFEILLIMMTSGVVKTVIFVFPVKGGGDEALEQNVVWHASCKILPGVVLGERER